MRIIMLGPPGSGKGTQGDLIEKEYGFPKISSGDLLREAVQQNTSLGKMAKAAMKRGELVSDEIVVQMIETRLSLEDCQKGYILDGFPRNIQQAHMLEGIADERAEVVLDIRVNEKKVINRLSSRRICSRCGNIYNLTLKSPVQPGECDACGAELVQRQDDKPEVIKERLRVYHREIRPLVAHYQKRGNYHPIDGDQSIESVFHSILTVLKAQLTKSNRSEAVR
jgi:adenylate kinase